MRTLYPLRFLPLIFLFLTSASAVSQAEISPQVKARYSVNVPGADTRLIEPSPLPGFYQLVFRNSIYYMKEDASHMFVGHLYDAKKSENLSEKRLRRERLGALRAMEGSLISYDHTGHYRGDVYVFTDINCGYCRRFHANMGAINKLGIRVNYILTPLLGGDSMLKALAVQCAKDQSYAMDVAKGGGRVPLSHCQNSIEDNIRAALAIGMTGTPAVLLESGELISGYMEPDVLLEKVEGRD